MVFSWLQFAVILFLLAGLLFAGMPMIISTLVAPRAKGGDFRMPFECGMPPHGSPWTRFGVNYAIYALLFLAFDVDVLYLFPVAGYYHTAEGILPFIKVFLFLAVLGLSILYFWVKGVFTWPRKLS